MNKILTLAVLLCAQLAKAQTPFLKDGVAGFVVSDIAYALGADALGTDACPQGSSLNSMEIYALQTGARQGANESEKDFDDRLQNGAQKLAVSASGQDLCMNPEAGEADPYFKTLQGSDLVVEGIDLDGVDDANDFHGSDGVTGVDNQFYRTMGCSRSFQSTGQSNGFKVEMLSGSWGIVIELYGVDDIRNDDSVDVVISASADPLQLSAARDPLPYATYAKDQDAAFRSRAKGRIENGVLLSEPMDVRFHSAVNSMKLERPLMDARVQATLDEDGNLSGILAGYTPVEAMYNVQFGYRNGAAVDGDLAPLRLRQGSANGAARVLGYTCQGVYHALYELADAKPDPQTGAFTAISTQYRFSAIPAFVVDIETESKNAGLKQSREYISDY